MKVFYITGVSGSGKSTVLKALNRKGFATIDIDDIDGLCYWVNNATGKLVDYKSGVGPEWLSNHSWICNKHKLLKEIDEQKSLVVFVGGLADNKEDILSIFTGIFLFQAANSTLIKRLTDPRRSHDFGANADERRYLLQQKQAYETSMLQSGAIPIDASAPVDEVVESILGKI